METVAEEQMNGQINRESHPVDQQRLWRADLPLHAFLMGHGHFNAYLHKLKRAYLLQMRLLGSRALSRYQWKFFCVLLPGLRWFRTHLKL